jgi:hypothetical protein
MRGVTLSPVISNWQQSLQILLSSLQPGSAFSTLERSLIVFFAKSLVAKMACLGEECSAFAF